MSKAFNEGTFQAEALELKDKLTVVDFYTTTCGPCRRLAPTVEKLAEEYGDAVNIGKCDVSENMELGTNFKISAVPTIIFIKNGKEIDRHLGLLSEDAFRNLVERHK